MTSTIGDRVPYVEPVRRCDRTAATLHRLVAAKHHANDHEPELSRMLPAGYQRPDDA